MTESWEEEQPFPCDWQEEGQHPFFGEYCGVSPSRGVQTSNGTIFYFCEAHREEMLPSLPMPGELGYIQTGHHPLAGDIVPKDTPVELAGEAEDS